MIYWRIFKWTALVLAILFVGAFFHYNLPRTDVVRITGTDVKRMDLGTGHYVGPRTPGTKKGIVIETRDVRFINTINRNESVRVFRNEDTGWGWPPYFKFDSADVTAEAQTFATVKKDEWVLVKYYGWRIQLLSMFPNAVSMRAVPKDYTYINYFNIVFLTLLLVLVILFIRWIRRLWARARLAERIDEGTRPVSNFFQRIKAWFGSWRSKPKQE